MAGINMRNIIETAFLAISGLFVALAMSWLLLASMNFSYPIWLDHMGVSEAIDRFGPENNFKKGFHKTTREQRVELFEAINHSIHQGGKGLAEIEFTVEGEVTQKMLREPEVEHLQDVANLIDVGKVFALLSLVLWLAVWGYLAYFKRAIPSFVKQMLVIVGVLSLVSASVVLYGAVDVFYALHIMIFPEGHQWFFYYQDSLMSTLMYAPFLFGWIAIELLVLAIICYAVVQYAAMSIHKKLTSSSSHIKKGA